MAIKKYNPTSAGRRAGSVIDYKAVITKFEPEKSLTQGKRRASGRNHHGVITAKHRGGGNKKLYRIIDFRRLKDGVEAKVEAVEAIYNVKVVDVRTMNRKGKPRRTKFKMTHGSDWKRAVVVLAEDSKIDLF